MFAGHAAREGKGGSKCWARVLERARERVEGKDIQRWKPKGTDRGDLARVFE